MRWTTLAKVIGKNVRRIRESKNLTQEKASELGKTLSLRHWQYIEKGQLNLTLHSLVRIAKALNCNPKDLL